MENLTMAVLSISDLVSSLFMKLSKRLPFWLLVEKYFLNYKKIFFYERDLKNIPPHNSKIQMNVRQAKPADLEKLVKLRKSEPKFSEHHVDERRYLKILFERLNDGCVCFIATHNDEVLGHLWIAFSNLYENEMNRNIVLSDKAVMFFDLYTSSSYRGLGVAPKITEHVFNYLKENNFEKIYVMVNQQNFSSRKTTEKNFKPVDIITFIKFFGHSYVAHRSKYAHIQIEKIKKH
jgi:ribosomal protein S18 acetylase RimI-like enzyme